MKPLPLSDVDAFPNAEWHGGIAERTILARGVSQGEIIARSVSEGVQTATPSLTLRAKIRSKTAKSVAIWLVLWSLLLLPLLRGTVPTADDLGAYHLPLRSFYQSALQHGENWTWCPWIFGGYHLHGEGQIGGDHPLHQLLYRVLPLHWAFGLECWWAYPATFFGMWWWLRQLRFSTAASQVAGLTLSLCGFMTLRVVHVNAIQIIAHLPWLLGSLTWLEHRARRTYSLRSLLTPIACSALLTGSQLLLGYPQYVVFTLIAESLWLVALMIRSPKVNGTLPTCWLAAKTIGLLLGASQVLPTLEYLALSERINWTSEQMFEGSWPLLNLTQLVAPYLFKTRVVGQNTHELTIYMGILPVCLAMLGLVNRPRRSLRVVKGFAIVLCATGLLLALGEMIPLAGMLPYIPVWNRFRFPCRATLLLCLGIVLLAALGWQRVCELARNYQAKIPNNLPGKGFSRGEWYALGLCVAGSCLLPIYAALAWPEYVNGWQAQLIAPVLAVCSLGLLLVAVCGGTHARNLLPLLICFDLWFYAMTTPAWQQRHQVFLLPLPKLTESRSDWHVAGGIGPRTIGSSDSNGLQPASVSINADSPAFQKNAFMATHTRIDGYAGVKPMKRLTYRSCREWEVAGIAEIYSFRAWQDKHERSDRFVYEESLPRGTLLTQTQVTTDWQQQIARLDTHTTALVDAPVQLDAPSPTDHLQLQLTADRPGRLAFALDNNRDALLVTTESFHPGWRVSVDGADVPALRVNGDFLGARIPPSSQRVECYFSDNWHTVGRWLSLGSVGLLGLVFCLTRRRVARASCP